MVDGYGQHPAPSKVTLRAVGAFRNRACMCKTFHVLGMHHLECLECKTLQGSIGVDTRCGKGTLARRHFGLFQMVKSTVLRVQMGCRLMWKVTCCDTTDLAWKGLFPAPLLRANSSSACCSRLPAMGIRPSAWRYVSTGDLKIMRLLHLCCQAHCATGRSGHCIGQLRKSMLSAAV